MELSTYIGVAPRTSGVNASGNLIARGLRVILNSSGQIALAGNAVRGDYITLIDIANNENGIVVSCESGGKVAVQASQAASNVADLCYSAANGQVTNVSTGAVLIGRFTQPVAAANTLVEVELFNPA
jgi:hypothetical protein